MIVYALKSTFVEGGLCRPRYVTWEHTWGTSLHRAQLYETRDLAARGLKSRRLAPEEWEIIKVRINEVKDAEPPAELETSLIYGEFGTPKTSEPTTQVTGAPA